MLLRMNFKKLFVCIPFMFMAVICCHPGMSAAAPYQLTDAIQIQSVISDGSEDTEEPQQIWWIVVPKANNDGSIGLSFTMQGADQPICRMDISSAGSQVKWQSPALGPDVVLNKDLFINPGYPAPCDILPVSKIINSKEKAIVYEVKRKAGSTMLVERMTVECLPVSIDDARANGWIRDSGVAGSLWMIQVRNLRTDVLMVRQLWPAGGSWWMYEETPYRRSWQVR